MVIPDASAADEYAQFVETAIRELATAHPMHRFYYFSTVPHYSNLPNAHWIRKRGTKGNLSRCWWYQMQLPRLLKSIAADVVVATEGYGSLRSSCPQCLLLPHGFFAPSENSARKGLPAAAHINRSKRIAVFAEALKISPGYKNPVSLTKIQVVPGAISAHFVPLDDAQSESARDHYTGGTAYLLCTGPEPGSVMPVLKAFSQFKKRQKSSMKLVVITKATNHAALDDQLSGYRFRQDVVLLQIEESGEEARLYGAAYAVIAAAAGSLTSVVKALRCRVPVVTVDENRSFTQEAALYFDDKQNLAEQLMLVYKDENLRSRIIENGRGLAALHSWENSTAALWQCIAAAVNK